MVEYIKRSHYSDYSSLFLLVRLVESLIVGGGLWVIAALYDMPWRHELSLFAVAAVVFYTFFSEAFVVYRSWRVSPLSDELRTILFVWIAVVFCELLLAYASKTSSIYSRRVLLTWFISVPIVLISLRLSVRYYLRQLRKNGRNIRTFAIAGANEHAATLANTISRSRWLGLKLIGLYDDSYLIDGGSTTLETDEYYVPVKGSLEDLVATAKTGRIDRVYIALPMTQEEKIKSLVSQLGNTTASVYFAPGLFVSSLIGSRWESIESIPILSIQESPFYGPNEVVKRIEDVVLATIILLIITFPMMLIGLGVKLTSPGPVLFKQRRYGLDGEEIEVWKFRTMTVTEDGDDAARQATKDDDRLTPFGAFLRRTSLDELPQFINVLQGRMTIVGPRPHPVALNEAYKEQIQGYMLRHKVKPGITGLAQVNGWRGQTDKPEKMQRRIDHDLEYIRNWSFWLDIKIVFLTIFKGFVGKNAY